jgi:pimeloyl-ACP methyl ester carboxylesterase
MKNLFALILPPSLIVVIALFSGCGTASQLPGNSLAEAQSHFAKLGTNKIHYLTVGAGRQTIVFVHGWAGNSRVWREQIPAFANKAKLVLVDLPGHGQSDAPHFAYTMDYFASAMLAVMRDAHVDRAVLVGHSMGVPVICRLHRKSPDSVAALVAVDGILRRPPIAAEQGEQIIAPFRAADYKEHTKRFIGSMFREPGTEVLRDQVLSETLATPQHVMLGAMEGMFGTNQPDWDIKRAYVPVLVINAKNPMWTSDYESYVHSLSPRTDYRFVEGTGHWVMLEKPAEFNATLTEMLRKFKLIAG